MMPQMRQELKSVARDEIANRDAYTVRMQFGDDTVAVDIKECTRQATVSIIDRAGTS